MTEFRVKWTIARSNRKTHRVRRHQQIMGWTDPNALARALDLWLPSSDPSIGTVCTGIIHAQHDGTRKGQRFWLVSHSSLPKHQPLMSLDILLCTLSHEVTNFMPFVIYSCIFHNGFHLHFSYPLNPLQSCGGTGAQMPLGRRQSTC